MFFVVVVTFFIQFNDWRMLLMLWFGVRDVSQKCISCHKCVLLYHKCVFLYHKHVLLHHKCVLLCRKCIYSHIHYSNISWLFNEKRIFIYTAEPLFEIFSSRNNFSWDDKHPQFSLNNRYNCILCKKFQMNSRKNETIARKKS